MCLAKTAEYWKLYATILQPFLKMLWVGISWVTWNKNKTKFIVERASLQDLHLPWSRLMLGDRCNDGNVVLGIRRIKKRVETSSPWRNLQKNRINKLSTYWIIQNNGDECCVFRPAKACALRMFKNDKKLLLFIIFECFWSFLTMQTHVQAFVRWSKYTTDEQHDLL